VDQTKLNVSGIYKFVSGDCDATADISIGQTGDSVEVNQDGQTIKGEWSLSESGDVVVSYGEDLSCLGVFNDPNLLTSCHTSDRSCTAKWERTDSFEVRPSSKVDTAATALSPTDVSGELELVSTNCPFAKAVPRTLTLIQFDDEIQLQTDSNIAFAASIGPHGSNSAAGSMKLDGDTPCHYLINTDKVEVLCLSGELSCGIQYVYK
jgi:hypothetical protein